MELPLDITFNPQILFCYPIESCHQVSHHNQGGQDDKISDVLFVETQKA